MGLAGPLGSINLGGFLNYYDQEKLCVGCTNSAGISTNSASLFDLSLGPLWSWDFINVWNEPDGSAPTLR